MHCTRAAVAAVDGGGGVKRSSGSGLGPHLDSPLSSTTNLYELLVRERPCIEHRAWLGARSRKALGRARLEGRRQKQAKRFSQSGSKTSVESFESATTGRQNIT